MLQSRCLTLLAALVAFGAAMVICMILPSHHDDDDDDDGDDDSPTPLGSTRRVRGEPSNVIVFKKARA